jgi:hypothetical protein
MILDRWKNFCWGIEVRGWCVGVVEWDGVRGKIRIPYCIEDAEQEDIRAIYRDYGWRSGMGEGSGCKKEECRAKLPDRQDRDAGRKMEEYSVARVARAAERRARVAAKAVAGGREPAWDTEGNAILHSEDQM